MNRNRNDTNEVEARVVDTSDQAVRNRPTTVTTAPVVAVQG